MKIQFRRFFILLLTVIFTLLPATGCKNTDKRLSDEVILEEIISAESSEISSNTRANSSILTTSSSKAQDTTSVKSNTSSNVSLSKNPNTTSNKTTTTSTACTTHTYIETIEKTATKLADGIKKFKCSVCGNSYTKSFPKSSSIKILAIGNSFSMDGEQYLWNICKEGGYEEVVIANLYKGGCTLEQHWNYISNKTESYTYYKNTNGTWKSTSNITAQTAISEEEWDIITVQQGSSQSTNTSKFDYLPNIITFIQDNSHARIFWHMTWAYYNDTNAKMYNGIISAVNSKILTNNNFVGVIPTGTTIQNLRSSYLDESDITRDTGSHLSYDYSRYAATLTWYATLTGKPIDNINWVPANFPTLTNHFALIRESVNNALKTPYAITPSQYKTAP